MKAKISEFEEIDCTALKADWEYSVCPLGIVWLKKYLKINIRHML
jgi:hypothetical protein